MSKCIQKCQHIGMKHFDEICELAEDNYGIVTSKEATEIGVSRSELSRYTKAGRLSRLGNGVYKLARHTPSWARCCRAAPSRAEAA